MIGLEIDFNELVEYTKNELGNLSKKAKPVLKRAINKTTKEAAKRSIQQTKKVYTAKRYIGTASGFNITKANVGTLQAVLRSSGKNVPLNRFSHTVGKKRITAIINKEKGRKPIPRHGNKAFVTSGIGSEEAGNPIMARVSGKYMKNMASRKSKNLTKHTEALEKKFSISKPVMIGNKNTWGKIEQEMQFKLCENINNEIAKELAKK